MAATTACPKCQCGKDAVLKRCQKYGPNKDRDFFTCASRLCRFFAPADGKPWVRGTQRNGIFRPFKKFRTGSGGVKEAYETSKAFELSKAGVDFLNRVLAPYEPKRDTGERTQTSANRITAIRLYPNIKISRCSASDFNIKQKALPDTKEVSAGLVTPPTPIKRKRSIGYKWDLGTISNYKIKCESGRDEESMVYLQQFFDNLGTDPKTTLAEMGKKTGSCCICGKPLSDPKSIAQGYGSVCAKIFDAE